MKIGISVFGGGSREETAQALRNLAETILILSDEEIQAGGDLESEGLTCQYDEYND